MTLHSYFKGAIGELLNRLGHRLLLPRKHYHGAAHDDATTRAPLGDHAQVGGLRLLGPPLAEVDQSTTELDHGLP